MAETISQEELDERMAILRRFRALLEQQRTKFREYLKVLEMQESKIAMQDTESIKAHSDLENQIVEGIGSLQKVIGPMQKLYLSARKSTYNTLLGARCKVVAWVTNALNQMTSP